MRSACCATLLDDLDDAQTAQAMDALTTAMTERATPEGVWLDSRVWVRDGRGPFRLRDDASP